MLSLRKHCFKPYLFGRPLKIVAEIQNKLFILEQLEESERSDERIIQFLMVHRICLSGQRKGC